MSYFRPEDVDTVASAMSPEPRATIHVTIIDLSYTGYIAGMLQHAIKFEAFLPQQPNDAAYQINSVDLADASDGMIGFLQVIANHGFLPAPSFTPTADHYGRVAQFKSIVNTVVAQHPDTHIIFKVVCNNTLVRNISRQLQLGNPQLRFVFVEHKLTLDKSSNNQRRNFAIIPLSTVFPDALPTKPTDEEIATILQDRS